MTVVAGIFVYRRRSSRRQPLDTLPPQANAVSMFMNPLHQGPADYEEPVTLNPVRVADDDGLMALDSEMYVAAAPAGGQDSSYAVFRSTSAAKVTDDTKYSVFRSKGLERDAAA